MLTTISSIICIIFVLAVLSFFLGLVIVTSKGMLRYTYRYIYPFVWSCFLKPSLDIYLSNFMKSRAAANADKWLCRREKSAMEDAGFFVFPRTYQGPSTLWGLPRKKELRRKTGGWIMFIRKNGFKVPWSPSEAKLFQSLYAPPIPRTVIYRDNGLYEVESRFIFYPVLASEDGKNMNPGLPFVRHYRVFIRMHLRRRFLFVFRKWSVESMETTEQTMLYIHRAITDEEIRNALAGIDRPPNDTPDYRKKKKLEAQKGYRE